MSLVPTGPVITVVPDSRVSRMPGKRTPNWSPRPQMVMVLTHRSWVDETGGASPADVASSWYGLSPTLRLTLDLAPGGYSGLLPVSANLGAVAPYPLVAVAFTFMVCLNLSFLSGWAGRTAGPGRWPAVG